MRRKPEKLEHKCIMCKAPVTHTVSVGIVFSTDPACKRVVEVSVPICDSCRDGCIVQVLPAPAKLKSLPTHAPYELTPSGFPPLAGEAFIENGPIVVGCPLCGQMTSLTDEFSLDEDGKITPSFVCMCGFHAWVIVGKDVSHRKNHQKELDDAHLEEYLEDCYPDCPQGMCPAYACECDS
jgi:hypothetical protein